MNHTRPQTRQIREHGLATGRPQLRVIPVPEQSASTSRTRHQARQQPVRISDKDTAMTGCGVAMAMQPNPPQPVRNPGLSMSEASLPTSIGREPDQPQVRTRRRIAVVATRPMRFPVRIRTN